MVAFTYRSHLAHVLDCINALSSSVSTSCAAIKSDCLRADDLDVFEEAERRVLAILTNLRSTRNGVQPINRLPIEIICRIFSLLPDLIPSAHSNHFEDESPFFQWITVTSVCRRWREAALAFPSLWTTIDTYNVPAAETFIVRSGQCPIDVYLRRNYLFHDNFNRFTRILVHHLPRVRTLHLGIQHSNSNIELGKLLEAPAPLLKHLSLFTSNSIPITSPLFAGHCPRLTDLTISRISNIPPYRFTNLTRFCFWELVDTLKGMTRIANLLRDNPSLEELVLGNSTGKPHDFQRLLGNIIAESQFQSVHLPRLHDMTFSGYTNEGVAQFLALLSLPPTLCASFVDIKCHLSRCSIEYIFPPNSTGAISMHDVLHLRIMQVDQSHIMITCIKETGSFVIEMGTGKKSWPSLICQSLDYLARTMEGNGTCRLKELWLGNIVSYNWAGLLAVASTPCLTKICILPHRKSVKPIFDHFATPLYAQRTPNIGALEISIGDNIEVELALLVEFVNIRARLGVPIHRISLKLGHRVGQLEENLEILKQHVEKVNCMIDCRNYSFASLSTVS